MAQKKTSIWERLKSGKLNRKQRKELARRVYADDPGLEFGCWTADLTRMAEWLRSCGIETVVMQSTGVYWIAVYDALEKAGFKVWLANARDTKNLPGRKSDVPESQWLMKLHTYGLLRNSFRPPEQIRAVRTIWRLRDRNVRDAAREIQHMQKAITTMNVQLANVLSDVAGVSGQAKAGSQPAAGRIARRPRRRMYDGSGMPVNSTKPHAELHTRRAACSLLAGLGLTGCSEPRATGSPDAVSRLSKYSKQQGLGISLLWHPRLLTQFPYDPANPRTRTIPFLAAIKEPVMAFPADWGRALVIDYLPELQVVDMTGNRTGRVFAAVGLEGCTLRKPRWLLFWGQEQSPAQREVGADHPLPYGIYLADLAAGQARALSRFTISSRTGLPRATASFVADDPPKIRLSIGYDTSLVGPDGKVLDREPWGLELVESSPDGRFLAGIRPSGSLTIVEMPSRRTSDLPVFPLGRMRWDPSSRYILAVQRTWFTGGEILVVDARTHDIVRFPPISLDNRYQPYEWVLQPDAGDDPTG